MQIEDLKIRTIVSMVLLIMVTFFFQPSSVGGASVVLTDKNIYNQGEMIKVIFSNSPGNDSDWICIVPAGSQDTDGGDYKYMPRGLSRGSMIFDPRSPGQYEVRAYYNYRRNGYVVSGRYAFSVVSDPALEEALAQDMEPIDLNNSPEANLPPPIPFVAPPNVIVLPGTDVYVVPDVEEEIFFQGGWWWRPWGGHWYRSKYHDHGWAYYRDSPAWYKGIPRDWRHSYSNHIWGGRPWNPPHINHGNLDSHWRGRRWRNNNGLGRPVKPALPGGGPVIGKPGGPGKPVPPAAGPGGGKPGRGLGKPALPGGAPGKPALHGGGPGIGKPGGGPEKPALPGGGPGGGKPGARGGSPDKPALRGFGFDHTDPNGR